MARWVELELLVGRLGTEALRRALLAAGGVQQRSVTIDGLRVPFLVRDGDAREPVVLIHGFGGDKESWMLMARYLSRRRAMIAVDLPGYGAASAVPAERATLRHQAAVLAELCDRLGLRRPHLVGNSMGGGIAQRFAADYPGRAGSLVLIGSMGPEAEPSVLDLALLRGENPLVPQHLDEADAFLAFVAERMPPVPRPMSRWAIAQRIAARDRLAALFAAIDKSVAPPDSGLPADLAAIQEPALVIHGALDRVIDVSSARALAASLPRASLRVLPGIGHLPQLEAPIEVARMIDVFIEGLA